MRKQKEKYLILCINPYDYLYSRIFFIASPISGKFCVRSFTLAQPDSNFLNSPSFLDALGFHFLLPFEIDA